MNMSSVSTVKCLKNQATCRCRPVHALRNVVPGTTPGPGINTDRRRDVGAGHADVSTKLGMFQRGRC